MANDLCPVCKNRGVQRQDGRLDQSGLTYLPTVVWRCAVCDYASYEAARHVRWLPTLAP